FTLNASGVFESKAVLEKVPEQTKSILQSLQSRMPSYFSGVVAAHRLVTVPFGDDRVFIFESVKDEATSRITVFLFIVQMSEVSETFQTSLSQKMYLIASDGTVLFGPDEMSGKKLQDIVKLSF